MMIKFIIVDDHPLVRRGIETATRLEKELDLVGSVSGIKEALRLIKELEPDVALVDLKLQDEHGLDLVRMGRQTCNHTRYIILTSYATEDEIQAALEEKVEGYVLKEALPEELISAIFTVARGRKHFDPAVVQYAMDKSQNTSKFDLGGLTQRELEVLKALSNGLNNREIAANLYISEHTVKKHVGAILEKLSLKDRTQAALFAVSKGLNRD